MHKNHLILLTLKIRHIEMRAAAMNKIIIVVIFLAFMNPHQFRLSHSSYLLILVFVLQTAAGGVGPVPGPDVSLLILRHIVDF